MIKQEVNLHELVKLPFGEAEKVLRKSGLWDDHAGQEPKTYKVKVSVTYITTETEEVKVEAYDKEEAMDKAEEEMLEDFDVEAAEAISAVELTL